MRRDEQTVDEQSIRATSESFMDARNHRDPKALAGTFSEDADFTNWPDERSRSEAGADRVSTKAGNRKQSKTWTCMEKLS
jgi:ketosteroid isomerase-like protein